MQKFYKPFIRVSIQKLLFDVYILNILSFIFYSKTYRECTIGQATSSILTAFMYMLTA